jgi:hypothetical protein
MTSLTLSSLAHTWLIDFDGTVVRHNGHLTGKDELLDGVEAFWASIPAGDTVVLMSARPIDRSEAALALMARHGLRVDRLLFGLPTGERILINDAKPSGLVTALAVNLVRDEGPGGVAVEVSPGL